MDVPGDAADFMGSSNTSLVEEGPLLSGFRRVIRVLKAAFMPSRCMGCGELFNPPEVYSLPYRSKAGGDCDDEPNVSVTGNGPDAGNLRIVSPAAAASMSQWVCARCMDGWLPVVSPLCSVCGRPFKIREGDDHVCGECLINPKHFRMARAAAIYTPLTLALAHGFKYRGKIQLAGPCGAMLADVCEKFWEVENIDFVVPVPLHRIRFRRRGFNQAYLLAKALLRQLERMGYDAANIAVERGILIRTRRTASQTGLKRTGRLDNIKGAFRVENPATIENRRILLVDDVYTTGATVNECAKVLRSSGAARIDVLTVARAV